MADADADTDIRKKRGDGRGERTKKKGKAIKSAGVGEVGGATPGCPLKQRGAALTRRQTAALFLRDVCALWSATTTTTPPAGGNIRIVATTENAAAAARLAASGCAAAPSPTAALFGLHAILGDDEHAVRPPL
jgi:hypothetical protein